MIARPCINFLAHLEPRDLEASPDDCAGDIVPQNEGWTIRQYKLEFSVTDLGVQKIHSSCMNSNQDIVVAQLRLWQVGQAQSAFLFVFVDNECLHRVFSNWVAASGVEEGKGLRHEIDMVLENPAMPGIFVDNELSARDTARHIGAVCARHHDVVVAIRDEYRNPNASKILRRLPAPSSDRLELPKAPGLGPLSRYALRSFSRCRKGFRGLAAIVRRREKQVEFWVSQREQAFDYKWPGHRPHVVDASAARRARAGQNEFLHEVRCLQRDVLRHKAAEGKAE